MKRTFLFALIGLMSINVQATEGISDVALNVQQKTAYVQFLQNRIARHQTQSVDQIREELVSEIRSNAATLGFDPDQDAQIQAVVTHVNSLEKEEILIEQILELQNAMSSTNYVFEVTRWMLDFASGGWVVFWIIITVPLDIVLLVPAVVVSAFTGF